MSTDRSGTNRKSWLIVPALLLTAVAAGDALAQAAQSSQGLRHPAIAGSRQIEPARPAVNVPRPVVEPAQNPLMPRVQPARPHPPGLFALVRDLPPEEQERVLANSVRFQRQPPERQARIRLTLQRWNSLSPERKQILREREAIVQSLSPPQRQELQAVFPLYRRLAPARRQEVMRAFLHLRDLPANERQAFLSSAETEEQLSPPEREILGRLGQLLPNSAP